MVRNKALSLRIWRRHLFRFARKTTRNKNRGYCRDMVVKTFERLYNEFLPCKTSNLGENGVQRAHEVATRSGGAPPRLLSCSCTFRTTFYFPNFLNRFQNGVKMLLQNFCSRFTYCITYLFLFRVLEHSGRFPLCTPLVLLD